jgi:hypothetical protein
MFSLSLEMYIIPVGPSPPFHPVQTNQPPPARHIYYVSLGLIGLRTHVLLP